MAGWFFGNSKNKRIEDIFAEHGMLAVTGAEALDNLLQHPDNIQFISRIHEIEHEGDKLTHEAHKIVDSMLIPKFDKEDIIELVSRLDDITDTMRKIARKLSAFKIARSHPEVTEFMPVVKASAEKVGELMAALRTGKLKKISSVAIEIKELEERGDAVLHAALGKLFIGEPDGKMFVIWKKIFEELEQITDHCEKVADVVMTIARKHAR